MKNFWHSTRCIVSIAFLFIGSRNSAAMSIDASIGSGLDYKTASTLGLLIGFDLPYFSVNSGIRAISVFGSNKVRFQTADGDLRNEAKITKIDIASPQINALNIPIDLRVKVLGFFAGMNIDLIGYSFGGNRSGTYSEDPLAGSHAGDFDPNGLDLFLVAYKDLGTLQSEFFIGYEFLPSLSMRAGTSHLATEYRPKFDLPNKDQRIKKFSDQFFIALAFAI